MNPREKKNLCKKLRLSLVRLLDNRFRLQTGWIQNHIANCPRCRARLIGYSRLEMAFGLLKSQPHSLELLQHANCQALSVLQHSLRQAPQAQFLREVLPKPKWYQRLLKYTHSLGNAAACLTILFLMRIGIFSSMNEFHREGEKAVKQYYRHYLGDTDMMDDMFRS